jgi:putative DNA primase/helicase
LRDGDKADKTFRQRRPDPDHPGRWLHNVDGVAPVLYRLPQVQEAIAAGRPVLVVEGEAKADLLWSWNVAATCCAGGAKKWKPEHSEFLRGADVVILPDNDGVGWEHANVVGSSLSGIAKRIRVVALAHAKAKDDVADWAAAGGTREQLDAALEAAPDFKPLDAEEIDKHAADEKADAKAREDELLAKLEKAEPGLEYRRQRDEVAKELRVGKTDIDAELKRRREAAPLFGHWTVEPWPDPPDGDALLRDIIRRIRRHVVCSHDDALVVALWVMLSWVHEECATHSPILLITSAEPESGKTTLLSIVGYLAPRAIASVEISGAALYRSIQLWRPAFVIDEFDAVLASTDDDKQALRSIINSGHVRGQGVIRCEGDDKRPERFETFAPKALGMIGKKLPPATLGRCIAVALQRRLKDEKIERFAHQDDAELGDLRRRLLRWSLDSADALGGDVVTPFDNRRADNWRVMLAIADLAGEEWGDMARAAAVKLEAASDTTSPAVQCVIAIKKIFDEDGVEAILSAALVVRLKEDVEAPWLEWNRGKGLSQKGLADLLGGRRRGQGNRGGFGIFSVDVHLPGGIHGKGYRRSQFEQVWLRYAPNEPGSGGE